MKTYYQCEKCGKKFDTKSEAEECEKLCTEKEENAKRLKEEKRDRAEKLEEAIKDFSRDYGEPELTQEISRILKKVVAPSYWQRLFNNPLWWF